MSQMADKMERGLTHTLHNPMLIRECNTSIEVDWSVNAIVFRKNPWNGNNDWWKKYTSKRIKIRKDKYNLIRTKRVIQQ